MITAQEIKDYRSKNQIAQKKLAEMFGVSIQTIQKWEQGFNLPKKNVLWVQFIRGEISNEVKK
jgi:DNA-binding transcriptional regulator YiaG